MTVTLPVTVPGKLSPAEPGPGSVTRSGGPGCLARGGGGALGPGLSLAGPGLAGVPNLLLAMMAAVQRLTGRGPDRAGLEGRSRPE